MENIRIRNAFGGGGGARRGAGDPSGGLAGPEDSVFQTPKPVLVLAGMSALFFLAMVLFG